MMSLNGIFPVIDCVHQILLSVNEQKMEHFLLGTKGLGSHILVLQR